MEQKDIQASFKYNEVVDEVKIKTKFIKNIIDDAKYTLTLPYENITNFKGMWIISDFISEDPNYGKPYITKRTEELKRIEDGEYTYIANYLLECSEYLIELNEPTKAHVIKTIANELKWGF